MSFKNLFIYVKQINSLSNFPQEPLGDFMTVATVVKEE